jgi:hypothetical protein
VSVVGVWVWGTVVLAIVLVIAGGIAWWLARGCALTRIGALGAVLGGVVALGALAMVLDTDAALTAAASLTIVSGAWLLGWALAGAGSRAPAQRSSGQSARSSRVPCVAIGCRVATSIA